MKLIFCPKCWDVFKLAKKVRSCECGLCKGRYDDDEHHAVTNGEGVALAFNNYTLSDAVANLGMARTQDQPVSGWEKELKFTAWVREHSGESNPRSRVEPNL